MKKMLRTSSVLSLLFVQFFISGVAAEAAGKILVRVRGIDVIPVESSEITVINGEANADNAIVPELDFSYFFTENIGMELILATTKHNVVAEKTDLGVVPLGSIWVLPPTLTLQYHFLPRGQVCPYVGVGLNFTIFYNETLPAATVTDISYGGSFGPAFQGGVDVALNDKWDLNLDLKKVLINTNVEINDNAIHADVDLHPWILGAGFRYHF